MASVGNHCGELLVKRMLLSVCRAGLDVSIFSVSDKDVKFRSDSPTRTPQRISRGAVPQKTGSPAGSSKVVDIGTHTLKGRKHHRPDWTNQDVSLTKSLPDNKLLVAVFDGNS